MRMTGYMGMDLQRFVALVRAQRRLIAAIVAVAAVFAAGLSLTQSDRYQASADLLFGRTTNADAIIAGGTTDTGRLPERAAATNLALASLDTVAVRVGRQFAGITPAELKDSVSIKAAGESDVVTVTAELDSPKSAAAVANAFAAEIVALRREAARADIQRAIDALQATVAAEQQARGTGPATEAERTGQERLSQLKALKELQTGNVQVVEAATPPEHRSSPKPLRNALIAALVALLLSAFVVVLLARFDDRIGNEEELAALLDVPVLTRIPNDARAGRLTDTASTNDESAFAEAFEFLRLNMELMGHDDDCAVVAVTSPAAADGKTTVVAWLARSLARSGAEVVAVDLDLRKPDLHRYFAGSSQREGAVLEALLESGYDENGNADRSPWRAEDGRQDRSPPELLDDERSPHGRRTHSEEDIRLGLVELARHGGHARRAARSLAASGRTIPESTLRRWKDVHAQRYAELRAARRRGVIVAPRLRVLAAANRHPQMPAGIIARARLRQFFDDLREDADFVVVDTVPVSTVADASAVAAAADGVILVVNLDQARRRDVLAAQTQLANARAKLFGIVVNRTAVDLPVYRTPENDRTSERAPTGT
jgi:Mrp family chromosome partitioning ATPase/capsular polysaccharide biosynthesis protein